MNIVSFALGIVTLVMGLGLKGLILSRLPPGRLKQTGEALAEARGHVRRLVGRSHITEERAAYVLLDIDGCVPFVAAVIPLIVDFLRDQWSDWTSCTTSYGWM